MKITVLNGSPRPQGNTAKMTAAFREAAEGAGHTVTEFNVCRMNIHGCLACEYCHGKGEGVLRRALINDLSYRHKTYTWQDASFQEYGYGATQVTIK